MPHYNKNYISSGKISRPREIISIPVPLIKSIEGRYFVGQTDALNAGNGMIAWAGLVNPHDSGVNLYGNVFTISNFSDEYLTAGIWLNTNFPEESEISHKVSPANTVLEPLPQNKVDIRFAESTTEMPKDGVNVYERIVPPNTTLVGEEDGKFIEPPDGNYTLVIKASSEDTIKVIVAFGWWERLQY